MSYNERKSHRQWEMKHEFASIFIFYSPSHFEWRQRPFKAAAVKQTPFIFVSRSSTRGYSWCKFQNINNILEVIKADWRTWSGAQTKVDLFFGFSVIFVRDNRCIQWTWLVSSIHKIFDLKGTADLHQEWTMNMSTKIFDQYPRSSSSPLSLCITDRTFTSSSVGVSSSEFPLAVQPSVLRSSREAIAHLLRTLSMEDAEERRFAIYEYHLTYSCSFGD